MVVSATVLAANVASPFISAAITYEATALGQDRKINTINLAIGVKPNTKLSPNPISGHTTNFKNAAK